MNKVFLLGYIGKKGVDLRLGSGSGIAISNFSLSVPKEFSKGDKKEYDFINCVAFKGIAEFLANNADKIKKILIEGSISTRNYEGKDGAKKYVTEVLVSKATVIEWNDNNADIPTDLTPEGDSPF